MANEQSVYDPTIVEKKWKQWWTEHHTNEIDLKAATNPYYVLMMFPYPSAEGLHVGNVYAFTGADVYARHRRLRGYDVFEPIGFDAFGIHSENFAMKVNRHPSELIPSNIANFTRQLTMMGFMFDWRRTADTTTPEYYKWTQWIFLQLYKAGLAYRDTKEVNYCPDCGTVIADEQVNPDGTCERHGTTMVERRAMPCWFFRITEFAEDLHQNHQWLDWSDRTKTAQLQWVGRSEGAEVDFEIAGLNESAASGDAAPQPEEESMAARERAEAAGLVYTDLSSLSLDEKTCRSIPRYLAETYRLVPLEVKEDETIRLATSNVSLDEKLRNLTAKYYQSAHQRELKDVLGSRYLEQARLEDILGRKVEIVYTDEDQVRAALEANRWPQAIRVFTTRPDTLFGATYMVLSPEHPLVDMIADPSKAEEIASYRKVCAEKTDDERTENKEKTGVNIGAKAINPVNGQEVPVYISDYVLMGYGTGAIMAVPCGDHRDFAFAKKFDLPVVGIIDPELEGAKAECLSGIDNGQEMLSDKSRHGELRQLILDGKAAWSGPGKLINSGNAEVQLDNLTVEVSKPKVTEWLAGKGLGRRRVTYRLRDWGISRQRYWGPPIPIIYDEEGNAHPVPEDQLPVTLPDMMDFRPKGDGRGPLATADDWVNTTLPDGRPGRRETDVMDNFLDSAWYFLRYLSSADDHQAYDPELVKKWLPLDIYIGGNEHAVLHLMYTRFICLALAKAGVLQMGDAKETRGTGEPFKVFRAHGLIVKDGAKMSKSKGNVVNPDEYVEDYGADTLRMYLMFLGPYLQGGDFRDKDIEGVARFLKRLYAWYTEASQPVVPDEELDKKLSVKTHQTIKKVSGDIDALSYNTAIAAIMELFNEARASDKVSDFVKETLILCLAPFAPHFAEEIWQVVLGKTESIWGGGKFPAYVEEMTKLDEVEIALQHQGKIKDRIMVPSGATEKELEEIALGNEKIQAALGGRTVRKMIIVPGRLVNVIG